MERTLASLQICRGELHHHHLAKEEKAWDQDRSSALLYVSFETLATNYYQYPYKFLFFMLYVVSASSF